MSAYSARRPAAPSQSRRTRRRWRRRWRGARRRTTPPKRPRRGRAAPPTGLNPHCFRYGGGMGLGRAAQGGQGAQEADRHGRRAGAAHRRRRRPHPHPPPPSPPPSPPFRRLHLHHRVHLNPPPFSAPSALSVPLHRLPHRLPHCASRPPPSRKHTAPGPSSRKHRQPRRTGSRRQSNGSTGSREGDCDAGLHACASEAASGHWSGDEEELRVEEQKVNVQYGGDVAAAKKAAADEVRSARQEFEAREDDLANYELGEHEGRVRTIEDQGP